MTSPITTHILDTANGRPAAGVPVSLSRVSESGEIQLGSGTTDGDGRVMSGLINEIDFEPGTYRIQFQTGAYFDEIGCQSFYPEVSITFIVNPGNPHYHVPLLISPFGYSTYRGS
mgnify:CR=1 FL=1